MSEEPTRAGLDANRKQQTEAEAKKHAKQKPKARKVIRKAMWLASPAVAGEQKVAGEMAR